MTVEGLFHREGGSSYSETLEFLAELTCRPREVPTCTAPIVVTYAWSQLLAEHGDTPREAAYAAEHSEDDAGEHLRVKVESRSRARGDPAEPLGLVLLATGKHAYTRLLTRELVALTPVGAAASGP